MLHAFSRIAGMLIVAGAAVIATGCATLPHAAVRAATSAIAAFDSTPLAAEVAARTPTDGKSGFMLQPYGPNALATRLVLAKLATRSIDVQYYLLRADNTGLALMRALRDASARGVRVRLLIDDY